VSKLPVVNFRKMNAVLLRLGFEATRQKGSHVFYRHPDGHTTTVPDHGAKDLNTPLIRSILRDIDLTPERFREILETL
jgi:predicted RNA binding protein YcfA (HicA-like mRNA interferase family)